MAGEPADLIAWGFLIAGMTSVYAGFKDKSAFKFGVNEVAKALGKTVIYKDDSLSHWAKASVSSTSSGGSGTVSAGGLPAGSGGSGGPWSVFQQGGGDTVAENWAVDLLNSLGAPASPGNVQFIYDWEKAEGGGGKFNPLNQGPVPGHPELTSTGQQYGGGASDFVSWEAGLTGAADYINMGAYSGVLEGLKSNNPEAAKEALWASPWAASHYGYGANWPDTAPPPPDVINPLGTGTHQ